MALLSYNKFFAMEPRVGEPAPPGPLPTADAGPLPPVEGPPPPPPPAPGPPAPGPDQAIEGAGNTTSPKPADEPHAADFLGALSGAFGGGDDKAAKGSDPAKPGGGEGGAGGALGGVAGDNPMSMFMSAISAFFDGSLMDMLKAGGLRDVKLSAADKSKAEKAADDAYSRLDLSKDNVLLSFQGTGQHALDPNVAAGAGPGTAVAHVDYPADLKMDRGVAFGEEAGRILIERLKSEGKNVSLYGYSQGAMVASNLAGDKEIYDQIDHALLVGHPVSAKYQFDDGKSSKVSEVNAQGDGYASTPDNKNLSIFSIMGGLQAHGSYDMRALVAEHIANSFGGGGGGGGGSSKPRKASYSNVDA